MFGVRVLPRADDASMPHVWEVLRRFGRPESSAADSSPAVVGVLEAVWFTFRVSMAGLLLGVLVGLLLGVVMQRYAVAERGLLPYVVLSQTVPLIALAPLVVGWAGRLHIGELTWRPWMSVAVIAAYLAFFPMAVGALRGLRSPPAYAVELMRSYSASYRQSLLRLRLPASVPYLIPALRLAAAAAVVGAIVAEISTGTRGRDRPADHRVLPGGHLGPREGLHGIPRRGRARAAGRRPGGAARPRAGPLPAGRSPLMTGPAAAVELSGVDKVFPGGRGRSEVPALVGVDLAIAAGDFVTFIGPSGCGKSTLLRLIADLTEPSAGTVRVNGKSARQARLDQDYGIAFQQAGLMDWRTVAAQRRAAAGAARLGPVQAAPAGAGTAGAGRAWPTSPGPSRPSCPAACSSGPPSPGRWPPGPSCC